MGMRTDHVEGMIEEYPFDHILQEDLNIIANSSISFERMKEKTILVTGATGLIGVSIVRALLCINRLKGYRIRILALVRNKEKAEKIYGNLLNRGYFNLVVGDINLEINIDYPIDYIIHCASITKSKTMVCEPVETLMTSINGTHNILELARNKKCKSVVYLSSMEVYGTISSNSQDVRENDLGVIDPLKVRSNYPESKRLCENMCVAYLAEYGVPVKIARLAQTFGAGILENENRVFAQFARCAINNENIILHTTGQSEGNYCYTRDVVRAIFIILLNGKNGTAYNVSNPDSHMTIFEMATLVASQIADNRIKVIVDIHDNIDYGYAPATKMKLNSDKIMNLGWKPEVSLKKSYERMIESMNSKK